MRVRGPHSLTPRFLRRGFVPLSVVIPLRNRDALTETLAAICRNAAGCELELIVVHNGSPFELPENVQEMFAAAPNLSCQWIPCEARQEARSLGAKAARYEHILFLDEDIHPLNENFFRVHASLHSACPEKNFVVLGSVIWPEWNGCAIRLEPGHLLADGEQLSWAGPNPLTFVDYRYFSGANVSVKKSLVQDWTVDGFSADFPAALGGLELAYRVSRRHSAGLKIFYDPAALGTRQRSRTLRQLMTEEVSLGRALKLLVDRCPETARDLGLRPYIDALHNSADGDPQSLSTDYASTVEGIKAWVRIVADRVGLGSEPWHSGLLHAALELCLLQGLVGAPADGRIKRAPGALMLNRFMRRLRQLLHDQLSERDRPPTRRNQQT